MLSNSAPLISVIGLSLANWYASLPNVAVVTVVTVHTREVQKYIYFLHYPENPAVLRIRINDRKLEQVADLKGFLATVFWGFWLGLDPEDSPLMLRDAGTQDVYSLDWTAASYSQIRLSH